MSECIHCGATDDRDHGIVVGAIGEQNNTVCNVCRAEELRERTGLKRREAEVQALKEVGFRHAEIGELLGIAKSTVDEYSSRINDRVRRAHGTIDLVDRN